MDATSVRRRWPARCIAVVRAVPMVLAITLAVVHFTPLIPWVVRRMAVWDEQPTRGVLVVLGAEQQTDGTLGLMSYWRCFYAAEAWRHGQFSRILVSGRGSAPIGPRSENRQPRAASKHGPTIWNCPVS